MKCCNKEKGFLRGLLYGLTAHSFCIFFIVFTALGVSTVTTLLRPLFISRYFFHALVGMAIFFTTISAVIYLKRNKILSFEGIKQKKGYLLTLYGSTIAINLILFLVVFPIAANMRMDKGIKEATISSFRKINNTVLADTEEMITVQTDIPCSGHAYLVFVDLEDLNGIKNINFRFPNIFDISYDTQLITKEEILNVEIFQTYKTTVM